MKKFGIVISVILLSVLACNKLDDERSQKLNIIETRLDSSLALMLKVDTIENSDKKEHYFYNLDYLRTQLKDTISRELAFFIDRYYSVRKSFKAYGENFGKHLKELQLLKQQLENLRHDAENGLIDSEKFDQYLQQESNNVLIANGNSTELLRHINAFQTIYDSLNPRIDSLVEASKAKISNE